jgi:hypothetical protein
MNSSSLLLRLIKIGSCILTFGISFPLAAEEGDSDPSVPTTQDAIDATQSAIDRLEDKIKDLIDTVDDALPYGEEPYMATDDGGYMSGDETVEDCVNTVIDSLLDWIDLDDQLKDLQHDQYLEDHPPLLVA